MKYKRHILHHIHHKCRKHAFPFFIFLVVIGALFVGYAVFQRMRTSPKTSPVPPVHIQGRITKVAPQEITVLVERPSPKDPQKVEQKTYQIAIEPKQVISLKTVYLKKTGPTVEKTQVSAKDIPSDGTIDALVQLSSSSSATGTLLSGEVMRVK